MNIRLSFSEKVLAGIDMEKNLFDEKFWVLEKIKNFKLNDFMHGFLSFYEDF